MLSGSFAHETVGPLRYLPFKLGISAGLRPCGYWQGVFAPLYRAGGGGGCVVFLHCLSQNHGNNGGYGTRNPTGTPFTSIHIP